MNSIQILSSRISDRIQKKKLRISNEVRLIDFRSSKEQKAERDHCDQQKWTDGVHKLLHNTNIPRRALRPGERGIGLQHFQGFVQVSLFFSFLFFFQIRPLLARILEKSVDENSENYYCVGSRVRKIAWDFVWIKNLLFFLSEDFKRFWRHISRYIEQSLSSLL